MVGDRPTKTFTDFTPYNIVTIHILELNVLYFCMYHTHYLRLKARGNQYAYRMTAGHIGRAKSCLDSDLNIAAHA